MKKIIILIGVFLLSACSFNQKEYKLNIVTSNFVSYDFVRSIIKDVDSANVTMLVPVGSDIHDYEPSPKDIINIKNSDLFIYVGGESDAWVDSIMSSLEEVKKIKLMDYVFLMDEEEVEGMQINENEEETEKDEHIWTSLINSQILLDAIRNEIVLIDEDNKEIYNQNADNYINEINDIHLKIKDTIEKAKNNELIFADRFPFLYFVKDYNLKYYAAFPGCAHETEASAKTISFLINKIKEDNINSVLTIELSNQQIAKTIKEETGVNIYTLNSLHNISKEEFESGVTYVSAMKNNLEILKKVLN